MADTSANGSLRGRNMTRVTPDTPRLLADPYGKLYGDPFGPPRDPLDRPDDPMVVHRDIPIATVAGDWTIGGIKAALAGHKMGLFAGSAMLVDDAYGDDRVQATLGSRTGALFGQRVIHKRAKRDADRTCVRAWRSQWRTIAAQSGLAELKRWAIMLGFCVGEMLWDTSVTPWRLSIKPWHPQYIYYRWDIRRFVANTTDGGVVIEPGSGKWFVHAPYGFYRGWMHGAIRAIADKWMIKQLAWRDWARFNERHGLPIIKAFVPAAGDARQKELFVQSMATLGQEAVVGLPQNIDETGYDLELMEARDRAWETFKGAIEAADRSIILTIKSQNLTTEVQEGSFAAARVHGNVEQVTLEFDNSTFAYDLYTQVARPFAKFNFGDQRLATYSSWDTTPVEDMAAQAKMLSDLSLAIQQLKLAGAPIDMRKICRKFGVPLDKGDVPKSAGQIFQYHINSGNIVTVNEVRAGLGLPPIDGGDAYTLPPAKPSEER